MSGNFNFQPSRRTGPLLAACLVAVLGAFGVSVMVIGGGQRPEVALYAFFAILGVLFVVGMIIRFLTREIAGTAYDWVRNRNARPDNEYSPELRRPKSHADHPHGPPTVADIRDLKEGLHTWVPSSEAVKAVQENRRRGKR